MWYVGFHVCSCLGELDVIGGSLDLCPASLPALYLPGPLPFLPLNHHLQIRLPGFHRLHAADRKLRQEQEALAGIVSELLLPVHVLLTFPFSLNSPCPPQFWSLHSHLKMGQEKSYFVVHEDAFGVCLLAAPALPPGQLGQ